MYIGQSERNLHDVFELARRSAPCVLFLDEVDALGQKRSQLRNAGDAYHGQPAAQPSSTTSRPATRASSCWPRRTRPWDVDAALRRPGRLDRTLLVLPPDAPAREAVFRYHLRERPVAGVDPDSLAARTDGLSGADIAHVCETAAERAMLDCVRTGRPG